MSASSQPKLAIATVSTVSHAKPLRLSEFRTERPRLDGYGRRAYAGADIFDRACNLWAGSNAEIARWGGYDERIVRDLRAGLRVLTLSRLLAMPPELVAIVSRLILDEVAHAV